MRNHDEPGNWGNTGLETGNGTDVFLCEMHRGNDSKHRRVTMRNKKVRPKNGTYQKVLDFCNEVRALLGYEPVNMLSAGTFSLKNNVLARTIGKEVLLKATGDEVRLKINELFVTVRTPYYIYDFMRDYGQFQYPDLVITESKKSVPPSNAEQRKILEFCNHIRKALGRKPVKEFRPGFRDNSQNDVIANTIGGGVEIDQETIQIHVAGYKGESTSPLPGYVQRFIKKFDQGRLPEFEIKVRED